MSRSILAGALGAAALALITGSASAMPAASVGDGARLIRVSGWADRAEGRSHTYAGPYSYGYRNGGYGAWGYDRGYAPAYGRVVPPGYGGDYGYGYGYGDAYGY